MEFIGKSFPEDFEEFLRDRAEMGNVYETKSAQVEQVLMDTGMILLEAGRTAIPIFEAMLANENAAYIKGVKDGSQLILHLLDMAPEKRSEAHVSA